MTIKEYCDRWPQIDENKQDILQVHILNLYTAPEYFLLLPLK